MNKIADETKGNLSLVSIPHRCLCLVHGDIQGRSTFGYANAEKSLRRNSHSSLACGSNVDYDQRYFAT